jgi:hypothetical protein
MWLCWWKDLKWSNGFEVGFSEALPPDLRGI